MAWQAEGLSNIEHSYRGNYHPDGRQRIYEEAISHLPWPDGDHETPPIGTPSSFSQTKPERRDAEQNRRDRKKSKIVIADHVIQYTVDA
jgi:hypothetical protein